MSGIKNLKKKLKIIVTAYACEPDNGSEPEVGWQWVQQLARRHKVWVLTRSNNEEKIKEANLNNSNLTFIYLDFPKWFRFWKKGNRGIHLYYMLWQWLALLKSFKLNRKISFDLSFHITFSPIYHVPYISLLPVPFIWGPVGAGEVLPTEYWQLFTFGQKLREILRILIRKCCVWNPLIFFAMLKAKIIFAATDETKEAIPSFFRNKVKVEVQIGVDFIRNDIVEREPDVFNIITGGRHLYYKGQIIIIRAFSQFLKDVGMKSHLCILSDGPEFPKLQKEVRKLGLEDFVTFKKWLPQRDDIFKEFAGNDIFAYSCFLECGGCIVLEAMSSGLPAVALDLGGPGKIVDNECGIKIKSGNIDCVIKDFANAFKLLSGDRDLLMVKKELTIRRVENEFCWNIKGERLLDEMESLLKN